MLRLLPPDETPEARLPAETPYGAHMDIGQYGDLNSLQWVENEFDPAPNMLHCEVIYGARFLLTGRHAAAALASAC